MGKSIKDSDIRRLYGISVIAVKNPDGHMRFMPGADHIIAGDNHLMVIGKQEDAEKIVKQSDEKCIRRMMSPTDNRAGEMAACVDRLLFLRLFSFCGVCNC